MLDGAAQKRQAVIDRINFDVYGLDKSWTGHRWMSGHGTSYGALSSVTMTFGRHHVDGSAYLEIRTSRDPQLARADLAARLARRLLADRAQHSPAIGATFDPDGNPTDSWSPQVFDVEGRAVEGLQLVGDGDASWVAIVDAPDAAIGLYARAIGPADCHLTTIADFDRYLDGRWIDE